MKVNRDQLKTLIKECLVEILAEGLGNNLTETVAKRPYSVARPTAAQPRKSPLDELAFQRSVKIEQARTSKSGADAAVIRQVTSDPIMASIFADTLRSTLPQQDNPRNATAAGGDQAARVMAEVSDPTAIFGDDATAKWNEAAFAPSRQARPGLVQPDFDPYQPTPDMKPA